MIPIFTIYNYRMINHIKLIETLALTLVTLGQTYTNTKSMAFANKYTQINNYKQTK